MKKVVRVGVTNNFNCTKEEFAQLDKFSAEHPDNYFFINCNINTPNIEEINNHPYKVVLTVNPNIIDHDGFLLLNMIDPEKVAFVRVKYVPGNKKTLFLIDLLRNALGIPVVVTNQRFNSKKSVKTFGENFGKDNYVWQNTRYRLNEKNKKILEKFIKGYDNVYICDRKGTGCGGCGLCATLTVGQKLPIYSLNLSTSGICPFNCIDCFSKTMQKFVVGCGHSAIKYDVIYKNGKQKGTTKHIKDNLAKKSKA